MVSPLRRGEGPNKFQLSAMDTRTVTNPGDEGWSSRPPATLACPRCGTDIHQRDPHDRIDCPRCVAEFGYEEFGDLELRHLTCPACDRRMLHGRRHPGRFDIPEWATCTGCRYHWEFRHSYSR